MFLRGSTPRILRGSVPKISGTPANVRTVSARMSKFGTITRGVVVGGMFSGIRHASSLILKKSGVPKFLGLTCEHKKIAW